MSFYLSFVCQTRWFQDDQHRVCNSKHLAISRNPNSSHLPPLKTESQVVVQRISTHTVHPINTPPGDLEPTPMGWGIRSPWNTGRGGAKDLHVVKVLAVSSWWRWTAFLGEKIRWKFKSQKKDGESLVFSKKTRRCYLYIVCYIYICYVYVCYIVMLI